jgi:hypothetical protein
VDELIKLLLQHPILLIVVGFWLLGLVGKVLGSVGKQAAQATKEARDEARRRLEQVQRRSEAETRPAERPRAEPAPPRRRITQEEAIAEMRRLLGQPAPQKAPAQKISAPLVRDEGTHSAEEERQRKVVVVRPEGRRVAEPLRQLGDVEVHVDPHVGEAMQQRRAPESGRVGQADLGRLGGRTAARAAAAQRHHRGLVDVSDLKRMLIMRELLGPPLALRPDWRPGHID